MEEQEQTVVEELHKIADLDWVRVEQDPTENLEMKVDLVQNNIDWVYSVVQGGLDQIEVQEQWVMNFVG